MPPAVGCRPDAMGAVHVPRKTHVVQPMAWIVEGPLDVVCGVLTRCKVIARSLVRRCRRRRWERGWRRSEQAGHTRVIMPRCSDVLRPQKANRPVEVDVPSNALWVGQACGTAAGHIRCLQCRAHARWRQAQTFVYFAATWSRKGSSRHSQASEHSTNRPPSRLTCGCRHRQHRLQGCRTIAVPGRSSLLHGRLFGLSQTWILLQS